MSTEGELRVTAAVIEIEGFTAELQAHEDGFWSMELPLANQLGERSRITQLPDYDTAVATAHEALAAWVSYYAIKSAAVDAYREKMIALQPRRPKES